MSKSFFKFQKIAQERSQPSQQLTERNPSLSRPASIKEESKQAEEQNQSRLFDDEQELPLIKKKILVEQNHQSVDYYNEDRNSDSDNDDMAFEDYSQPNIDQQGKSMVDSIRDYQKELFMKSYNQNSIIYLETGTGKTMVGAMLIYYYFKNQERRDHKKKIIFVANTVQLIEQQYAEIKRNLKNISEIMEKDSEMKEILECGKRNNYRREFDENNHITKAHGHFKGKENLKQLERFSKSKWESIKEKFEIIVMMGQVLLNGLRRGYMHIQDIEVIIFDECHHTRGDHPYNLIMYEFYHFYKRRNAKSIEKVELPKIYGLTASPVLDVEIKSDSDVLRKKISELCSNLDATFSPYDIEKSKKYIKETNIQVESYDEESAIEKRANQVLQEKIIDEKWKSLIQNEGEEYEVLLNFYERFDKYYKDHYEEVDQMNKLVFNELQKIICCDSLQLDAQLGKYAISLFFKDVNIEFQKIKGFQHNQAIMVTLQKLFNEETNKFAQAFQKERKNVSKKFLFLYDQLKKTMIEDKIKFDNYKQEIKFNENAFHKGEKIQKLEQFMKQSQSMVLVFVQEKIIIKYLRLVLEQWMSDEDEGRGEEDKLFRFKKVVCLTGQSNVYNQKKKLQMDNVDNNSEFASNDNYEKSLQLYGILNKKVDYLDDGGEYDDLANLKIQINDHQHSTQNLTLVSFDFEVQKQTDNIDAFRKKELQIILSTSVTEEGFDIPSCNLVISFNQVSNLKSFVQIKGRARKENSKFLILAKDRNQKEDYEKNNDLYKDLIEQIKHMAPGVEKKDVEVRKQYKYKIERMTGAILNTNWSVMLFHSYANYLHYDIDWNIRGPFFYYIHTINVGYTCQIILPPSASSERRYYCSNPQPTKEDAKKDACFQAVIVLYRQFKIFDQHLRTYQQVMNQKQNVVHDALYEDKNDEKLVKILTKYTKSEFDEKQKYKRIYFDSVMGQSFKANFFFQQLKDDSQIKIQIYRFKFNNQENKIPNKGFSQKHQSELGFLHSTNLPIQEQIKYYLQIHKDDVYADMIFEQEAMITQEQYKRLMLVNRFLNSVSLNKDIEFYAEYTEVQMNSFGRLYKDKKKIDNMLYDYKFDNSEGFNAMITLLKPTQEDNQIYEINFDHIKIIEDYINYMSDVYKIRNKTKLTDEERKYRKEKAINTKEDQFADQKVKPFFDCINFFDRNQDNQNAQQRYEEAKEKLVLQNITSGKHFNRFIYYDCKNFGDIQFEYANKNEEMLQKIKKSKRQTEVEEVAFKINNNHMAMKLQIFDKKYLRKVVNHYLQRNNFLQEEEKKLGDFKHFPHQFTIFPMNVDLLMKLKIFQMCLLYQIRDTFAIHHFQRYRLPKMFNKAHNSIKDKDQSYELIQNSHFVVEHYEQLIESMRKDQKYHQFAKKYSISQPYQQVSDNLSKSGSPYQSISSTFEHYLNKIQNMKLSELIKSLTSVEYVVNNKYASLERYEFLGDTVLKCLASTQIYFEHQTKMEKHLHVYRTAIIFNKNLSKQAIKKKLFKYILASKMDHSQPLGIKYEAEEVSSEEQKQEQDKPKNEVKILDEYEIADQKIQKKEDGEDNFNEQPVFALQNLKPFSRHIKGKTHADALESIVGVFYWESKDINICQFLLNSMGVLAKPDLSFKHTFELNLRQSQLKNPIYLQLKGVEQKLKYTFSNINLLFQAFTLPDFETICSELPHVKDNKIKKIIEFKDKVQEGLISNTAAAIDPNDKNEMYPDNLKTHNLSNQRLEFLGDAVLDLIVVEQLFSKFEHADPGQLTSLKTQIVQNRTLCLVNLEQEFDQFIIGNIQKNQQDIYKLRQNKEEFKKDISLMYHEDYNQTLIKTLGDIIESLVCAIFIDNNLNYEATKKIVLTFMEPFITAYTKPEYTQKSGLPQIQKVLNQNFQDYGNVSLKDDPNDIYEGQKKYALVSDKFDDNIYETYAFDDFDALDKLFQLSLERLKKSKKK